MPKKKSVSVPEEPSYEVECIYGARVTEDAGWEYNIKWGGYSEEENSWEPEANLNGCGRMMAEFWQQVGPGLKARVKGLPVNHEVSPSLLWIKRQRTLYRKSLAEQKSQKNKPKPAKDEETDLQRTVVSASPPSSAAHDSDQPQSTSSDSNSDEDDMPLSVKALRITQPPAGKTVVSAANLSSKRKRDDDLSPEPPNKRPKASITAELSTTNLKADIITPNKATDSGSPRPASPVDSLFGDGPDSEDTPQASGSAPMTSQVESQLAQSLQSKTAAQSSIPPELHQKTKPKIPLHVQRKQNPKVKSMALPPLDTNFGGISTKTRILLQDGAKSTSPSLAKPSASFSAGDPLSAGGSHANPAPTDNPDIPPLAATLEIDAEIWLKENIITKDDSAQVVSDATRPVSVEPAGATTSSQQLPHFSKRWRWTGQLAIGDNESGFAESIGNIVLSDNTPVDRGKLSLEALLPSHVDTICLRHQYSLSALPTVLRDFKLSQFAIMTADRLDEESCFDDVVLYMVKHELFSQSLVNIADIEAATMFIFPSTFPPLLDSLNVPAKVRQEKGLVVAIGFKTYVPPKRILGGAAVTYSEDWKTGTKLDLLPETQPLDCGRARLALNFPDNLFQRLTHKQCTIFTTPSDQDLPGHDTLALISVLENAPGCKIVPVLTGNARFVFIHVSSWGILHKLPGLVDRRLRRPDVQFYTYGSDPSVERKKWGVHEVFPLGGIVTFTPRAIVEDPAGIEQLIAKLDAHPLWACYVLPSVIPMLRKVAAEKTESNYATKSGIGALCSILIPIEKGQLALTWQPPHRLACDANSVVDWMIDQANISKLQGNDLVEECEKRFQRQQDHSEKDIEAQIVKDLLVMQSELREEYRRFVIITDTTVPSNFSREAAASTSVRNADIKDGFEQTHVKDFVFNDDFFLTDGP